MENEENQNQVSLRFPPPLEIAPRFPQSHNPDDDSPLPKTQNQKARKEPQRLKKPQPPSSGSSFDEKMLSQPWSPTNVYTELDSELESIDLSDSGLDVDAALEETIAATVATLGADLVRVVYNLNVEAEREGKQPTFKPTTKSFLACAIIPSRVATDERSFYDVVDSLYFLLYEGSGAAARLTAAYTPEQLQSLWRLKHLRLGARHDVDHGSASDIERKNQQVGEAYEVLIGSVHPRTRSDWLRSQIALYRELVAMLEALWYGDNE